MKIYKIEIAVIDHDEVGEEEIKLIIENTRYPNRCISPDVKSIECRDIGPWHDDHPLNIHATENAEYRRLFSTEPNP